jgi:hypothetical protein
MRRRWKMNLFLKLLALARVTFPLPSFADAAKFLDWWNSLGPAVSEFITALAEQLNTTGKAVIELPTGAVVTLVRQADGGFSMNEEDKALLCTANPQAFGEGKWREIVQKLLPVLIQILPLILATDADEKKKPTPPPAPIPTPVV